MMEEAISRMFDFDIAGETYSVLIICLFIIIFSFVVYFKFKNADPLQEKPSKFVCVITMGVEKVQSMVLSIMGKKWLSFSGYACALFVFVFLAFVFGLIGLPGPMSYMATPLTLGLCTFILIHATAMKANKIKYLTRYTDPLPPYIPIFVPINLLSMWAPLLSLTLRLFGNAISGSVLMSIIYYFFAFVSDNLFAFIESNIRFAILTPIITPVFHAYFDIMSGAIQTLVFTMLTMIFVSQEDPDESSEETNSLNLQEN